MMRLLPIMVLLVALPVHAATLYLDPSEGTYGPGDTFIASVRLDNAGECINAADITIAYPRESLKAVDFSRGSSIFTLWVTEPQIDLEQGLVHFAGGIPGGYCGRTPGDPVLTNTLGKIVFTVLQSSASAADIRFVSPHVLLHDGSGTEASLETQGTHISLAATGTQATNPWITEVRADGTPPDAFTVHVESTLGVFGGRYYLVFSTVDKQSGIDHYELFERGAWREVKSPYLLRDQLIRDDVQLRAIDKAGNQRLADFDRAAVPARVWSPRDYLLGGALSLLILCAVAYHFMRRRMTPIA